MKIAVSSYSYMTHMKKTGVDYTDICSLAKASGFDGIEFIDLDLAKQPATSQKALAETIRKHCESIDLPILAYTVGADFYVRGAVEAERICRQVDIAGILGAPLLRHDITWAKPEECDWRDVVQSVKTQVREVAEYAAGKGIRTCTENHGLLMQDADRIESLILAVDHPNFGWLIDVGNFLCADELAIHALPIALPYAFHIHVKDFLSKDADTDSPGAGWFDSRHGTHLRGTIVGHGVVPVAKCIDIVKQSGYDGAISLEFEGSEDNLPAIDAGLSFLRKYV